MNKIIILFISLIIGFNLTSCAQKPATETATENKATISQDNWMFQGILKRFEKNGITLSDTQKQELQKMTAKQIEKMTLARRDFEGELTEEANNKLSQKYMQELMASIYKDVITKEQREAARSNKMNNQ